MDALESKIRLNQLINEDIIKQFQRSFATFTGLQINAYDMEGDQIVSSDESTPIKCKNEGLNLALKHKKAMIFNCAGSVYFTSPIIVEREVIACFIGIGAKDAKRCQNAEQIQKSAKFLELLSSAISQMAHDNYRALKNSEQQKEVLKSQARFIMSVSTKIQEFLQNIFSSLDSISKNVKNEQNEEHLKCLSNASHSVFASIKDMIDYIKMSDEKIYLEEIKYQSSELKEQIFAQLLGYDARVILAPSVPEWLFGDPGRIGQMLVKIIKTILNEKSKAKILINLDSKKLAYALNLNITLNISKLENDEIEAFKNIFEEVNINFKNEKFDAVFLYLLFEQMFVSLDIKRNANSVTIMASIPQLKVSNN